MGALNSETIDAVANVRVFWCSFRVNTLGPNYIEFGDIRPDYKDQIFVHQNHWQQR